MIFEQVEGILKDLWDNEPRFCHLICDLQQSTLSMAERETGYGMFFLKVVPVPPNRFRPSAGSPDSDRGVSYFLFCQCYNLYIYLCGGKSQTYNFDTEVRAED